MSALFGLDRGMRGPRVAGRRRFRASAEPLEDRQLLSGTAPTDAEQYMLSLINRARANPAAEGQRLVSLAQSDPLIHQATNGEDLGLFLKTISAYAPEPPLAFDPRLIDAALAEDASMVALNAQKHSPPGFLYNSGVAVDTDGQSYFSIGSSGWATGENIFAYSAGVAQGSSTAYADYFEAGFLLDWGNPDFGHLKNILAPGPSGANPSGGVYPFNIVGIGMIAGAPSSPSSTGTDVGPQLVTQEFAWRAGTAYLAGTVFNDQGHTGSYLPGEGVGGVTIAAVGTAGQGTFRAQTWTSGGYSLALPPGTYQVVASGGGLASTSSTTVTIGRDNVGWDVVAPGPPSPPTSADIPVPADYDGLGHAEFATYRPSTGTWSIDNTSGTPYVVQFGQPGDVPVPGHYDGGTRAEIAVFRPSTATWYVLGPNGARAFQFGPVGSVPEPGDYDGDGKTDRAVYAPSTGMWYVLKSASQTLLASQFGQPGVDEPVPAAYDGGGVTEIAMLRPTTYQWYIVGPTGIRTIQFGFAGCIPVPAAYGGGGRADLALFSPSTATFYDKNSGVVRQIGAAKLDQPVPADYDGDGKVDLAVNRPTTGEWFVAGTRTGGMSCQFGRGGATQTLMGLTSSTIPLPAAWTPWVASPGAESAGGLGPPPVVVASHHPGHPPRHRRSVLQDRPSRPH
jgi:hypothetical protein